MDMQAGVIGAWRLLRWTRSNADGRSFEPFGATPAGRLIYQPGGLMAGFLMRPVWPVQPVDISVDPRWIGAVLRRAATFEKELFVLEAVEMDPAAPSQRLTWARE